MARLSVAVLGAPEVHHGRQPVALPTRKALALLVYLLVERGQHRRDKLVALFWPESDADAGRATLRSTLARLRDGLDDSADARHLLVARDAIGFDFASDHDLDLDSLASAYALARATDPRDHPAGEAIRDRIARLQAGADTWRGEFLDGFSLLDAPDFDDWSAFQREVWHRRIALVLDRLSALQDRAGASGDAVETANRWLRTDPLDERAHRRLMRLHLATGDRAAALRAYAACRAALAAELGARPEPETEALAERLRTQAPSPPPEPSPTPPPLAPLLEGALVGRADEFSALVERYHAAVRGAPQAVVVHGEAGIGKTRLATEFLGWAAAQGADVLRGRAFEAGARLPYQPLIDAVRPRLEREPSPTSLLGGTWLVELGRLLPELRDRHPGLAAPITGEATARPRLFEAVARLGAALAGRAPLVLFVDDLQWTDAASRDVLGYAARRWAQDGIPVLLLVGLRAEAVATAPALAEWVLGLRRDLAVTEIDLVPLGFADLLLLLRGLAPRTAPDPLLDRFARWLFAETGGQPFFVVETLRALAERGVLALLRGATGGWTIEFPADPAQDSGSGFLPSGVRRVIQARLAPLPPAARDLIAAAAVLGQGFGFDSLRRVGGLSEDDALSALDALVQRHLLRETGDGGRYAFTHDKIRNVAYAEAGAARRRVFHRRAYEALEAETAPAAELARHALAAGNDEAALRCSVAAGDAALRLLAARDAAAHYGQAIALAERLGHRDRLADLHARRGRAFVGVAMWADARHDLDAALADLGSDAPDRRADVLVDLADACFWLMDVPALRAHAIEVLVLAARLGRGDLETKALAWLATAEGSDGDLTASAAGNARAIDRARALGIAPPPVAHFRSMALYWLGRSGEAVAGGREAVAIARTANDVSWTMWGLPSLGLTLAGTGRYDEAARVFAEARQLGRDHGAETLLARAIACSAGFRLDLFDFAGAEALCHEARDLARAWNFTPPVVSAGIDLMFNYARRHEVGRAEQLVAEVAAGVENAAGFHGWLWRLRLATARAEIAIAREDPADALHWAEEAIAHSLARGRAKYHVLGLIARGQALLVQARTKEAIADLQRAVALARPIGDPALFLRAAAALLPVAGDDTLVAEGRATVDRIAASLPDTELRRRFEAAQPGRVFFPRTVAANATAP